MTRFSSQMLALVTGLAALAGFVDAIVWLSLGGYFAAAMSGNSTRTAVSLAEGLGGDVRIGLALILAFVSGVMGATVIGHRFAERRVPAVLLFVTALLAMGALLTRLVPGMLPVLALACAMGAENAAIRRDDGVPLGLSYVTGALVRFSHHLASALMGQEDHRGWMASGLLWLGFACGAVIGAQMFGLLGSQALWVAAVVASGLTILSGRVREIGAE